MVRASGIGGESGGADRAALRVSRARKITEEWALVLVAEGLHPTVSRVRAGFALDVPAEERERAAVALEAYERENPPELREDEESTARFDLRAGFCISAALLAFFAVTGPRDFALRWFERGSADAARILDGEWWRCVTALTLHADLGHVSANAIAGTVFLGAVCGSLGTGFGGALVLAAGAAGNFVNALVHAAHHSSVGASTAIFGAVGILGGFGVWRRRRRGARGRRALVPVAASLALLAMLGASARADLWGHLFGLVAGAVLGLGATRSFARRPGPALQGLLGAAALATLLYCWWAALV